MSSAMQIRKTFAAKTATPDPASDQPAGSFTAIVSVFGVLDLHGEIIDAGAFDKSIAAFEAGQKFPVWWSHDYSNPGSLIGELTGMRSTEKGLEVDAVLDIADNPTAHQVWQQMLKGRITEFSIGGTIPPDGWRVVWTNEDHTDCEIHISELELWEAGPCFKGANPETELVSVKSQLDDSRVAAEALKQPDPPAPPAAPTLAPATRAALALISITN